MSKDYDVENYIVAGAAVAFGAYLGMEGAKAASKVCNTLIDKASNARKKHKSEKTDK